MQRAVAVQEAHEERHHRRPEHRPDRREAEQHEHDDRDERQEVEPERPGELPHAGPRAEIHRLHAVLPRVDLDHEQQRQVVKAGRDRRHLDHVEIRDLEEFGDQERGRAEHRRGQDGAEPAGGEQASGGVPLVARLGEHRIGDRAERHGGRDARARRTAEQERREHDRAPGAGRLPAERGEREIEEELARARELQERAVDREEDDQRRRHVDRGAEDALERHVHRADEPADVVAAVAPGIGQVRPEHRVREEEDHDERHDPAGRAARRLEHEHHERDAHHHVEPVRRGAAVEEVVAALDRVEDRGDAEQREPEVDPAEAVAPPLRDREQQEHEEEHEADVRVAQRGRRDHPVRRVQVEERHRDRGDGEERAPRAGKAVGRPLLGLDELLGLLQALFGDDRFCRRSRRCVGHGPSSRGGAIIRHAPPNKKPRLGGASSDARAATSAGCPSRRST